MHKVPFDHPYHNYLWNSPKNILNVFWNIILQRQWWSTYVLLHPNLSLYPYVWRFLVQLYLCNDKIAAMSINNLRIYTCINEYNTYCLHYTRQHRHLPFKLTTSASKSVVFCCKSDNFSLRLLATSSDLSARILVSSS